MLRLAEAANVADVVAAAGTASILLHVFLEVKAEALWRRRAAGQVVTLQVALGGLLAAQALVETCAADAVRELVVEAGLRAAACAAHEQLIRARQRDEARRLLVRRGLRHHRRRPRLHDHLGHLAARLLATGTSGSSRNVLHATLTWQAVA